LCNIDSLKSNGNISRTETSNPENPQATCVEEDKSELLQTVSQNGETHEEPATGPWWSSVGRRKSLLSREGHSIDDGIILVDTDLPIGLEDGLVSGAGDLDVVFSKFDVCENGQCLSMDSIKVPVERLPSLASILSDKIDMAWSGSSELHCSIAQDLTTGGNGSHSLVNNPSYKKAISPARVHSFDSIFRLHEQEQTGLLPASLHLSLKMKSAQSFRDFTNLVKDPMTNMRRAFSQLSPRSRGNLNVILTRAPTYLKSASHMVSDGARLLLPHIGSEGALVVAVYDDEPTSIVAYAMTSQEYVEQVTDKLDTKCSFQHMSNYAAVSNNGLQKSLPSREAPSDFKGTHFKFSFDDEAFSADNTKFSVTCYFARHFALLRKKCCPSDIDYIRSLSRGKRWSADGGKSNVYFAKTMDDRFIIKQVTKTELDSFVEFAPHYFRHLTQSLASGSPTCLAKILGLYQVRHLQFLRSSTTLFLNQAFCNLLCCFHPG
jgi:1-phosphatidylinositol-3-phosphate 5-kinase